ncbi:polarized growth protein [Grosmannia clavigera kw1407]|uniref:Polarized growth protein n=1 Tax=Grosmannia clavigera (strain kw1407 / UAMH 11150) TaxID=655863 RepID=F0XSM3_GROCL|nr:polarized growth protein [Grosmannia clavigera kw1407]EFW99072.1 polarized growth protein [Grosmannia clavigera kw1407]
MAAAHQSRPDVGDILIVIHDFQARSSDELTLAKGDRVELLDRDDEFGDGWFLGKQMVSGNTGLFPEVYTRPGPKSFLTGPSALAAAKQQSMPPVPEAESSPEESRNQTPTESEEASRDMGLAPQTENGSQAAVASGVPSPTAAATTNNVSPPTTAGTLTDTISTSDSSQPSPSFAAVSAAAPASSLRSLLQPTTPTSSMTLNGRVSSSQDSQVLHETLNVIDEHITDLRSPSDSNGGMLAVTADSGSEYSSQLDHRMSYIHGEETDEEEEALHTRSEVESWNPDDVAEFLFTAGVEKHHCEVFRDQEISGEVLLGMDQASLFIKAFDLGPVGRRLKTWQKIKTLQDEVNNLVRPTTSHTRRSTQTYGSDVGSDDARRPSRSRTNTITSSSNTPVYQQQRLPPIDDRPFSIQSRRLSFSQASRMDPTMSPASHKSPQGLSSDGNASGRPVFHEKRPSAASIRDLHHSRRHSSVDYRLPSTSSVAQRMSNNGNFAEPDEPTPQHKKQPSFDRNWTLGGASANTSQAPQGQRVQRESVQMRPLSSAGVRDIVASPELDLRLDMGGLAGGLGESAIDYDRGYFSGPDTENRRKSFLQKKQRDSALKYGRGTASISGNSYAEEQRVRSATALSRHSRFGSVDSVRDSTISPAAQKYYGVATNGGSGPHRRTTSSNTADSSIMRPILPPKDTLAPTVTRLDTASNNNNGRTSFDRTRPSPVSPASPASNRNGEWFSVKPGFKAPGFGLRALSDAVSGHDRGKIISPVAHSDTFPKDSPMQSPSRTDSSTPSVGPSFELDSPDAKSPSTTGTGMSARTNAARRKNKKETSAYQRGLLKISPREAMLDADYSGWMKKKSSNLMATWKPRLFVLKGRRLAYYYSEDDEEEKGLIDISFHRVLPADNDRLTGLHATIMGASASPAVPANSSMPTLAETGADSEMALKAATSSDSIFIFKLTPPRAGLSRAVNFTKPMVHYFAVPNVSQGRLWMAALVKATIDRDDTVPVTTTYQQKTISLTKAREMQHRPPALMNLDEQLRASQGMLEGDRAIRDDDDYDDANVLGDDEKRMLVAALSTTGQRKVSDKAANGLGITYDEKDSGVSGVSSSPSADRLGVKVPYKAESARSRQFLFEPEKDDDRFPMSA